MDRVMSLWGGKTKEQLEKARRKLDYEVGEVEIKLKQRHPPKEVDKLEAKKRRLQYEIQEIDEDLKNLELKEEAAKEAHQREIDEMNNRHEKERLITNQRIMDNKTRRKQLLEKYGMAEDSTEVLASSCPCVIL